METECFFLFCVECKQLLHASKSSFVLENTTFVDSALESDFSCSSNGHGMKTTCDTLLHYKETRIWNKFVYVLVHSYCILSRRYTCLPLHWLEAIQVNMKKWNGMRRKITLLQIKTSCKRWHTQRALHLVFDFYIFVLSLFRIMNPNNMLRKRIEKNSDSRSYLYV